MSEDLAASRAAVAGRQGARADATAEMVIARINDNDRTFIIEPPLVYRPERVLDELVVMDERLSLVARGVTPQALYDALCQAIRDAWDRYTDPHLTAKDDGHKIGRALRRHIVVEDRNR